MEGGADILSKLLGIDDLPLLVLLVLGVRACRCGFIVRAEERKIESPLS
jgi:hypothetical protein